MSSASLSSGAGARLGLAEQRQVCVDGVDNLHCMATSQQRSLAPATDPHTYTRRPWWTFDASTTLEEEHSQSSHRLRLLQAAKFKGPRRLAVSTRSYCGRRPPPTRREVSRLPSVLSAKSSSGASFARALERRYSRVLTWTRSRPK